MENKPDTKESTPTPIQPIRTSEAEEFLADVIAHESRQVVAAAKAGQPTCSLDDEGGVLPLLYSVRDTATLLGISKDTVYRLLHVGELDAIKIRGRTLVTAESIGQVLRAVHWRA